MLPPPLLLPLPPKELLPEEDPPKFAPELLLLLELRPVDWVRLEPLVPPV